MRRPYLWLALPLAAAAAALLAAIAAQLPLMGVPRPDLRVEWSGAGGPGVRAKPGDTLELHYAITNAGDLDAFAVYLTAYSSLGPLREPLRLEPGPPAGSSLRGALVVPRWTGGSDLCLEVRLQSLAGRDPRETHLEDNTACRRIEVHEPLAATTDDPTNTTSSPTN